MMDDWKETCAKCLDGEIEPYHCEYYGEPNGCNSPTYGEHPSVANGAKCREALERCVKMLDICLLYSHEGYPGQNDDIRDVMDKANAALSAKGGAE